MDYKKLTKAQLVTMLTNAQAVLQPAIGKAETAARQYSADTQIITAFAFGHLIGSVKAANDVISGSHK